MEKNNKTRVAIIIIYLIYLIHLLLFIIISYFTNRNILSWIRIYQKLEIDSCIDYYNHIYIILYYTILSTYYMFKALNLYVNKKLGILIKIIGYLFAIIALYIYYTLRPFVDILIITNGLLISISAIYRKINLKDNLPY